MNTLENLFQINKPVIGMLHLKALPGTPKYSGNTLDIFRNAISDALSLQEAGIDGYIIENMSDRPYLNRYAGPEIIALMSIISYEIKNRTNKPCGIQILAGANHEALAVAKAAGLDFIRAEGFVFAHTADEGIMESDAGKLLRYRKNIDAENILVFTDIKKKHSSHSITADQNLEDTAIAAQYFLSDGVIITGKFTGVPADIEELSSIGDKLNIPVIIGSGITAENISAYLNLADGVIVGSYLKFENKWQNPVDPERVKELMAKAVKLRHNL